jgi:hypothetical protein
VTAIVAGAAPRAGWLQGPTHDLVMAFVWVPFACAALVAAGEPTRLQWLVSATLLFSFAHQPLTLWLAYGTAAQRREHLRVFAWAPPIAVVVIAIGSSVRPELIALVAGVWNVAHTIRQRYGVSRLYGRLNGVDCSGDNRLLWSWLSLAVMVALARADLAQTAADVGLGRRSMTVIEVLASARAATVVLLPVAAVLAAAVTVRAAREELHRGTHSTARLAYLGSTALLLVVLALDPVTGFIAYIGAHAAEYLLVVRWRIDRAADRPTPGDRVGDVARRIGSGGTIGVYGAAVAALILSMRALDGRHIVTTVALTLGALHLLYDGLIWRSPRPAVSESR